MRVSERGGVFVTGLDVGHMTPMKPCNKILESPAFQRFMSKHERRSIMIHFDYHERTEMIGMAFYDLLYLMGFFWGTL